MRKVAAQLGVHRTTALRWRHRFLRCPAGIQDLAMRGVVEADETDVLESFKGQRKALVLALALAKRPSRRRGGKARKRGLWSEQIPILVLRARTGQTADFVLPTAPDKGADKGAVKAVMASAVADDAVLCTDGSGLLTSAARALDIEHQPVNLSPGQRVRGAWHGRQRQRRPESTQAVAAPLQRRDQLLPRELPGLDASARPSRARYSRLRMAAHAGSQGLRSSSANANRRLYKAALHT